MNLKDYLPGESINRTNAGFFLTPVIITLALLLLDEYGLQGEFYQRFLGSFPYQNISPESASFFAQLHFSSACLIFLVALPVVFTGIFPSDDRNPFGLQIAGARKHWPIYFIMLGIMLPILWLVSASPGFYEFYPMYKPDGLQMWLLFETIYCLQFFAVEFFFRGFALFRLERHIGQFAIAVMVIPYGLLHIYKPFPEAVGSIIAGLVLGRLALVSRSIWPGLMVHCGVAISMDIFAMIRSGRLAVL